MNIFRKFKLYGIYRGLVKSHSDEILEQFNMRTDRLKRMYTVINVPDETQMYGEENAARLTETFLKNWLASLDKYLLENGIKEFTKVEEITPIDNQNFLVVIRYKYLNIANWIWISAGLGTITFVTFLILLFIKILFTANG